MSGAWQGGKGSRPRPYSVSQERFGNNWDAIFSKNKKSDAEKFDEAVMKDEYYDQEETQGNQEAK